MTKVDPERADELHQRALADAKKRKADKRQIITLLEEACKLGSGEAAWALGDWLRRGVGGDTDPARATRYFKLAASRRSANAAFDYAKALEIGYGTKKNERRARDTYLLSALLGDSQAAFEYFRCLWHGIGGRADRIMAEAVREHFTKIDCFSERSKGLKGRK